MPATLEQLASRLDLDALAKDYGRKSSEIDYVYVDEDNMEMLPPPQKTEVYEPFSETVSASKAEQWTTKLLEDPKVHIYLSWPHRPQ